MPGRQMVSPSFYQGELLAKVRDHSAAITIIGLGYVGLPLAVAFAERGFSVAGVDVDERRVRSLAAGHSHVQDVPSARLAQLLASKAFHPTTDLDVLAESDVAIICVPTPLGKTRDPDMRHVIAAGESLARRVHPGMLVVLESTTYPGTTEELLLPMLTQRPDGRRLCAGTDLFLAFSPERIDPGRTDYTVENTPKVVGGVTSACREVAVALYSQAITTVVPVASTRTAEMVKLLENTFRAVNIALVNEVAIMCDKLGIDVWEVVEAAATKPYGFMRFTPGPGVGGHCIPLDPHYLAWKLRLLNYNARFIQLAGEINSAMPKYWVEKVQDALNDAAKPVKGSRILLLGVAYKKDVGDVRESPALDIIELLRAKGAEIHYHDPYVPRIAHNGFSLISEPDLEPAIATADCVVIATDHSAYDWPAIHSQARLVVDTRHTSG